MGKNKKYYLSAVIFVGAILGSTYASAADGCKNLPLANGLAAGWQKMIDGATSFMPNPNTTVCVDIPNGLAQNYFVFNIDTPVTSDGTANGTPSALKHMWLMSSANLAFIKKQKADNNIDVSDSFSIKGIIHGSALKGAWNDDWWMAQVDEDGNQLYPNGNPNKAWFDKLNWLKAHGMDVQLEVCAVTLSGAGLTHNDVYPGILVNQGAFGRISKLHQTGYSVVAEGWVDNDKKRHHDDD